MTFRCCVRYCHATQWAPFHKQLQPLHLCHLSCLYGCTLHLRKDLPWKVGVSRVWVFFLLERGWWVWFLSRWFGTPGWVCGRTSERSICWPGEGKRAVRWGQGKRTTCHRWKLPEQPQPQHAVSHTQIQVQALCSPWSSMQPFHCSGEPSPYKTFYTGKSTPEFNSHLY